MKILLLSMPDSIPLFHEYKGFLPNLGIRSIAANVDVKNIKIRCLDLIFFPEDISRILKRAMNDFKPDLVGISAMTFQYRTALKVAEIVKRLNVRAKTALGGYHATLVYEEIARQDPPFDYIIRNEGEKCFGGLVRALECGESDLAKIRGLSYKKGSEFIHNEAEGLLDLNDIRPPRRDIDLFNRPGQTFGRTEVVEASRGCTMACGFCAIDHMYGRSFRKYSVERVVGDIRVLRDMGTTRVLFADDNVALDTEHFERICDGIIVAGLNDIYYGVQLSSRGVASNERLVKKMREANFGIVFLGIENVSRDRLRALGKGDIMRDTVTAIDYLHKYDIGIMGGFILGNPEDRPKDMEECFKFARKAKVDLVMASYLTPYPKTAVRKRLSEMNLIEYKDSYWRYNGFHPIARTKYMTVGELEKKMVRLNIGWYLGEIFNPNNWFVKSKRVPRHVYIRAVLMTIAMVIYFIRGGYGKSPHKI